MKKIVVCGLGYVGLVHILGCWISARDNGARDYMFIGYDPDEEKINKIMSGECPIVEPGLPEVLNDALKDPDHFKVCSDPACWYCDPDVDMVFCCVGTPMSDDGSADLRYVYELAESFGAHIGNLQATFVNKSTCPVGTCNVLYNIIIGNLNFGNSNIGVLSNPEFLAEGTALNDMLSPDRIVIGGITDHVERLREFYKSIGLMPDEADCVATTWENAELIKYASNAMLATRISFVNDLADLCEKVGADVRIVTECMGMDHRIGQAFLKPGPGYGGSCFPKDTNALLHQGISNGVEMRVVDAVIRSNTYHREKASNIVSELIGYVGPKGIGKIGVIGAAFKSGTGDLRESPAVDLLRYLANLGKEIMVFDENVSEKELSYAVPCDHPERLIMSPLEDLKDCNLVIIMNPENIVWPEAGTHDIRIVLDMRCCVSDSTIKDFENQGIIYIGHGRGNI